MTRGHDQHFVAANVYTDAVMALHDAERLLAAGLHAEALAALRASADLCGEDGALTLRVARTFAAQGHLDHAIATTRRALALEPTSVDGHLSLAKLLLRFALPAPGSAWAEHSHVHQLLEPLPAETSPLDVEALQEALEHLDYVARLAPEHDRAHSLRGIVLGKLGRLDEAVHAWHTAHQLRPESADLGTGLAAALFRAGHHRRAVNLFAQVLKRRPDSPEALVNLGLALREIGELDRAIQCFERAVRLRPTSPRTPIDLYHLALAVRDKGEVTEALELLRRAATLAPRDPEIQAALADLLLRASSSAEASTSRPSRPPLEVDLSTFPLAELLGFLAGQRATGALRIRAPAGPACFHLLGGRLAGAEAPSCPPLAAWLPEAQRPPEGAPVDDRVWISARLGRGLLSAEEASAAVSRQALAALVEALGWGEGEARFEPGPPDAPELAALAEVAMDANWALLDAMRLLDEAQRGGGGGGRVPG